MPFATRRACLRDLARGLVSLAGVLAAGPFVRRALARQDGASAAEQLIAAMQDGGKIIYWRYPAAAGGDQARELGRALYALRVPLNDIVAGPADQARRTAEAAFGTDRLRVAAELSSTAAAGDATKTVRQLLRTIPGPGMNRVLVGERAPLELAAERRFTETVLPEGAMAVFLPGQSPQLIGTITAERVIASAKSRGAL